MSTEALYCSLIEFGTPGFDEAVRLRYEILRKPLNLDFSAEDIALEYDSVHLGCYASATGELLGVLILKKIDNQVVKMRQVAVAANVQSQGVGSYMVKHSEHVARDLGFQVIELHAREQAVAFYKKLGYQPAGSTFQEVGIPHLFMSKKL
jgi:predicted GNAT family N-acyltransferase